MPDVAFVFTVSRARSIHAPKEVLGCQHNTINKFRVAILLLMRVKRKPVVIYTIIAM